MASYITGNSQNLLVNGTFEDVNICTEFMVECAPEAWISSTNGFANFFKDSNRAYKSLNCMGVEAGNFKKPAPGNRTFIRSRLLCSLRKDAQYRIEFYMKSFHDVHDSIGVWLSETDPLFDKRTLYNITPSIFVHGSLPPINGGDSTWKKVELMYTANGKEQFFALGYFAKEEYLGEKSHPLENRYYVFFDDISMTPVDPNERLCTDWQKIKEDIYDENDRHAFLERKIIYQKPTPPAPPTVIGNPNLRVETFVIPDILFATGKADLVRASHLILDSLCFRIKNVKFDSIVVEGHTDNVGDLLMNEKLSVDRSFTVASYIQQKTGIITNIVIRGLAFSRPVADNETPSGRQLNRRVEVHLYIKE